MADWKKSVSGNGFVLWDKGYTWGSVDDLSKYGKTGWEAELFTGRSGSKGLKTFASVDAAKAYVERSTADARNKQQARDAKSLDSAKRARMHRALDAVMDSRGAKDSAKGMTSTELRDEIRAVRAQISGGAGIMLKCEKPERYEQLEKRLTELLDAASYR